MVQRRPRAESREYFEDRLRIALLEDDADRAETRDADLARRDNELEEKLDKIIWLQFGILTSLTSGAILLGLNLLVMQ